MLIIHCLILFVISVYVVSIFYCQNFSLTPVSHNNKIIFEDFNIAHWATANSNENKFPEVGTQHGGEETVVTVSLGSTKCELCDLEELA